MKQYFDGSWKFGTAKLVYNNRKWFLHIPMSREIEEPQLSEIKQVVGIDLGINFLATSHDSLGKTDFYPGREVKRKRAYYKRLRQALQKKQTASSRRRLKQIGARESRYMTDVNHKVSKALVSQVDSRRTGFCYDSGHHYHHYPGDDLLHMYGSRLMALHLHDNNGSNAQHGIPFDGTINWPATMKKIAETNYSGAIAIEAMNWDYKHLSAKAFLHKAFERAKKMEALNHP